jgi:hypothetical protein
LVQVQVEWAQSELGHGYVQLCVFVVVDNLDHRAGVALPQRKEYVVIDQDDIKVGQRS